MSYDIAIWKWASESDRCDPDEAFELFTKEGKAHPKIALFDRKPLIDALKNRFGDVLDDDDEAPFFLEEITDPVVAEGYPPEILYFSVSWTKLEEALPDIVACAGMVGLVVYDPQKQSELWPEPSLMVDAAKATTFIFTIEGRPPIYDPPLDQVAKALTELNELDGPSFAILERKGGGYVQTAGGKRTVTVEWRETMPEGFRHFVAGRGPHAAKELPVRTLGANGTVFANETLAPKDASEIFDAFYNGEARPVAFSWRDVTASLTKP